MTDFHALDPESQTQTLAAFLAGHSAPEVAAVLLAMAEAGVAIAARIARGPLGGRLDAPVGENSDGDVQKALDIFADKAVEQALLPTPARAFISEEREAPTELNPNGRLLVALDPLDGSSNIDVNVTIGTIFSILDAPERSAAEAADFLQAGNRQRAAGLIVYGPHLAFVFTSGAGTHFATFDPDAGVFVMTRLHADIPEGKAEFAINTSNARHWPAAATDCRPQR